MDLGAGSLRQALPPLRRRAWAKRQYLRRLARHVASRSRSGAAGPATRAGDAQCDGGARHIGFRTRRACTDQLARAGGQEPHRSLTAQRWPTPGAGLSRRARHRVPACQHAALCAMGQTSAWRWRADLACRPVAQRAFALPRYCRQRHGLFETLASLCRAPLDSSGRGDWRWTRLSRWNRGALRFLKHFRELPEALFSGLRSAPTASRIDRSGIAGLASRLCRCHSRLTDKTRPLTVILSIRQPL